MKQHSAGGVNGVLELIGTGTLLDSLQASAPHGIVCFTGMLGNAWVLHDFEPMAAIPATVKLTQFSTESVTAANSTEALQQLVDGVAAGRYRLSLDKVFPFEHIVEAHRYMEENRAKGKLVVLVEGRPLL